MRPLREYNRKRCILLANCALHGSPTNGEDRRRPDPGIGIRSGAKPIVPSPSRAADRGTCTSEAQAAALQVALEALEKSGRLRLRVAGTSMLPNITPGSTVLVKRVSPEQAGVGDVALIRFGDGVRLHRIIGLDGTGSETRFVTRGDNHTEPDPVADTSRFLGVLEKVETLAPVQRSAWTFARVAARVRGLFDKGASR